MSKKTSPEGRMGPRVAPSGRRGGGRPPEVPSSVQDRGRLLFDRSPVGVLIYDRSMRVTDCNDRFVAILQSSRERLIGLDLNLLRDQSIVPTLRAALEGKEAYREGPYQATTAVVRIWATLRTAPFFANDGSVAGGIGIVEDTTEHRKAQLALQESRERLELALAGAGLAMWDWNLSTDVVVFDSRWSALLGYGPDELRWTRATVRRHVHAEDLPKLDESFSEHLRGLTPAWGSELRLRLKTGAWKWVHLLGRVVERDTDGRAVRAAGTIRDVSDRKLVEERLQRSAFYDRLTDLPNRALVLDRLGVALRRTELHIGTQCAVLFLDVDRFQHVNDGLGHRAGDELLKEVVRRVALLLRPGDTFGRLGGDEFLVVLDDIIDESSPIRVAERIRLALEEPVQVEGHAVHVTVSIGIAIATGARHSAEDLLRDADTAMNRAKEAGRDRYVLFDEAMHQTAVSRLDLENALRRSVERGEIVVSYQPVISVASAKLTGFEALARWQHPRRGLLLPPEFVPIAEETGLVVPIGRFVLGEACCQLRAWNEGRAGAPLRMSVNLSPRQVASPSLVEEVETAVEAAGIDPRLLRLEITESVLVDRPEEALSVLSRLRALGVQLALDDFGTGYSSLSYLVRFPVQELKLDRAFVSRVHHGEREAAVARAILVLAHELGMTVTAEGVETEEQLAWLRAEGFDHVQGNLLSRPLPATDAGRFVSGSFP